MIFKCRNCGDTSADIDMVLDGTCHCGCTHFQLSSENVPGVSKEISQKEQIRRDLHLWVDLNLDSMESSDIGSIRVAFECEKPKTA
ncbi:MAG: hypothetical protein E3J82_01690 [Candidatus Thorarchaeota archaeon]|jgi:predicted  nucleic acid-binding Zn-ribbon protein|nr:MAG: hypothetical protein E3J82_01690 [Candidatus Thorarchaeota archaeon]